MLNDIFPSAFEYAMWQYTDTDRDGIPDVVEVWFSNSSIVTNATYRNEFIKEYPALFVKYMWVLNYYDTMVEKQNESEAKQWLRDQFNPMIRDATPPMVLTFTVEWQVETSISLEPVKVYAKVHLVVRDVGSITYLHVVDEDSGERVKVNSAGTSVELNHKFRASVWQLGFGSVHIKLEAEDYAGNYIVVRKELKGAFGQVLDALADLRSGLLEYYLVGEVCGR